MEGFCRGCLIKYNEPTELLQYTEKNRRLYFYSTGLQVKCNDPLLFQLCKECYVNMKLSCKFKKLCRTSDKKLKNYLALKDTGDNLDFCTFLKNNDDLLTFRFPLMSGNSTPANQKCRDDDNESTCTSIRNFMTDILQGEEMPDTEARIIREVIEEEADILDDSLDSHWLQDDVSIDTDFRLDFSFSPFSTPHANNNDRYTPQKLSSEKVQEQLNYFTSKKIMERHDQIEIDIGKSNVLMEIDANPNLSTNIDIDQNIEPMDEKQDILTARIDFEAENTSSDISMDQSVIIPINIDISQDIIPIQINEKIIQSETDIDQNIILSDIAEDNISPDKLEHQGILTNINPENNTPIVIDMEGKNIPLLTEDIGKHIEYVDDINLTNIENEYYKANKEIYHIEKSYQILHPNVCADINKENINNVQCTIDKNLENALKDEDNKEFSLDELLVSPKVFSGASTPTIKNILFGDKLDIETDNNSNEHKAGQNIEKFEDVKGNIDVTDELFGNNANDFDIDFDDSEEDENDIFKVPLVPKDEDYDINNSRCNLCKKGFKHSKSLRLHFAMKHKMNILNPDKYKYIKTTKVCHICGKLYRDGNNLRVHLERHELDGQKTKCPICHLEFSSQARFDMHMKCHKADKITENKRKLHKYVCTICGATSNGRSNFRLHQRRHNQNYLFNCEECEKGFYRSADLAIHMRLHTGEKPYECAHCPKKFSRHDSFLRHLKLHLDNKVFQCPFCNKKFVNRSALNYHVKKSIPCLTKKEKLAPKASDDESKTKVIENEPAKTIKNQLPIIETELSN